MLPTYYITTYYINITYPRGLDRLNDTMVKQTSMAIDKCVINARIAPSMNVVPFTGHSFAGGLVYSTSSRLV